MRKVVNSALFEGFTQGAVFNGVCVDGVDKYGVVITARCDIEQGKVDRINYLVISRLDDWWREVGGNLVFKRLEKKISQEKSKILERNGFSGEVLDHYPEHVFVRLVKEKSERDGEELVRLFSINPRNVIDFDFSWVKGEKKSVLKDLFSQRLNGYYFLEEIDPHGGCEGYVIDLRMPMTVSLDFANEANTGIEDDSVLAELGCKDMIKKPEGEIIMFFSCICSPYIEHIMQSFSSTFSRIGLKDIDQEYINGKIGEYI